MQRRVERKSEWRLFAIAAIVIGFLVSPVPVSAASCSRDLGFAALHDAIPSSAGECTSAVQTDLQTGNVLQYTTRGELVWRASDGYTVFTDGYATWIDGPFGVQRRLNSVRFCWEGDAGVPAVSGDFCPVLLQIHPVSLAALSDLNDVQLRMLDYLYPVVTVSKFQLAAIFMDQTPDQQIGAVWEDLQQLIAGGYVNELALGNGPTLIRLAPGVARSLDIFEKRPMYFESGG